MGWLSMAVSILALVFQSLACSVPQRAYSHVSSAVLDDKILAPYKKYDINMTKPGNKNIVSDFKPAWTIVSSRRRRGMNLQWSASRYKEDQVCLQGVCVLPYHPNKGTHGYATFYQFSYNVNPTVQRFVDDVFRCVGKTLHSYFIVDAKCVGKKQAVEGWRIVMGATEDNKETWIAIMYNRLGKYPGNHFMTQGSNRLDWLVDDDRLIHVMQISHLVTYVPNRMLYQSYRALAGRPCLTTYISPFHTLPMKIEYRLEGPVNKIIRGDYKKARIEAEWMKNNVTEVSKLIRRAQVEIVAAMGARIKKAMDGARRGVDDVTRAKVSSKMRTTVGTNGIVNSRIIEKTKPTIRKEVFKQLQQWWQY